MLQAIAPNPLDSMLERIDAYMHTQPEEALRLCDEVFEQARALQQPVAYVTAAERYGRLMDHLGRGSESRDVLFAAQQVAQSALLFANEANLLEEIARSYYTAGQYRLAIQYWARCVEVSDHGERDAHTWILAKVGLSQVYFGLGDFKSGLTLLREAESRLNEVDDPHLEQPTEAYAAFLQARDICAKHEFSDYSAESNFRLGQLELLNGKLDAALDYLGTALIDARRVNYRWCEAQALAVQAEIFARKNDYHQALTTIKSAQEIALADGFRHMLAQHHFAAARYEEAGQNFSAALAEYKAGHECEQQIREQSTSERNKELEEKAGLRPTVSRLLVDLSNNRLIDDGQLDPAFRVITQEGSRILDVARASIWMLDQETGTLICRCLYVPAEAKYVNEAPLRRQDYPAFFARLLENSPLVAHDASHHPHTWELEKTYLQLHDIRSMLIFPLRTTSQTAGLLCVEAVAAQRNWTPDDIAHGNQLAEVATRVLSSYERIERTAALERHTAELHSLNDKLYNMKRQLLAAKPMTSIGELAVGAMHEIDRAAERIAAEIVDASPDNIPQIITRAEQDITRIRHIANDLREFSRFDHEQMVEFDLCAGIDGTLNLLGEEALKGVNIVRKFGNTPQVECHPGQIGQIFLHLILNAIDAVPTPGGEIQISTGGNTIEAWVTIRDNGSGISNERSKKIFDAFFTTKTSGNATGLGLPLCHNIAQAHHGRIEVNSKEGAGSTFTVRLPLKQTSAAATPSRTPAVHPLH